MPSIGVLYCLTSAAAFGAMGVFGKLTYEEGASIATLLATRFVLAALLFWALALCTGGARELRAIARRDLALALLAAGLALVLAGAGTGALDPLGALLGLGAACVYSAYTLSSEGVARRIAPLALATLVCTGAAASLTLGGLASGG